MKQFNVKLLLVGLIFSTGIFLTSCKPKDSDIQSSFNEKAKADSRMSGVTASVTDGVVTLNGQCTDDACKTAAEQTAKDVKGAKSVVNNITVMPAASTMPVDVNTDAALQTGIKDATKDYPGVTATVMNGEVTLTGSIERSKMPKLMSAIQGLSPKKVNNNLTIK